MDNGIAPLNARVRVIGEDMSAMCERIGVKQTWYEEDEALKMVYLLMREMMVSSIEKRLCSIRNENTVSSAQCIWCGTIFCGFEAVVGTFTSSV